MNNENEELEKRKKKRKWIRRLILAAVVLLVLLFPVLLMDGQIRKIRIYEKNQTIQESTEKAESPRINLAFKDNYVVTDDAPQISFGYPDQNKFDVVLTFVSEDGNTLYQTNYIAPGTNIVIDDGRVLCSGKGDNDVVMQIAVYDHDTGDLINGAITINTVVTYK